MPVPGIQREGRERALTHLQVRNWKLFQHYKFRSPPWIRLYCAHYKDWEFMALSEVERWRIVACWELASEDENMLGLFPDSEESFKHLWHISEPEPVLEPLVATGFIRRVESLEEAAEMLQKDHEEALVKNKEIPKRASKKRKNTNQSTEVRVQRSKKPPNQTESGNGAERELKKTLAEKFKLFYSKYPRKKKPGDAEKAWGQVVDSLETVDLILAAVDAQLVSFWPGKPLDKIQYPGSWLRSRSWEDVIEKPDAHFPSSRPAVRPSDQGATQGWDGKIKGEETI